MIHYALVCDAGHEFDGWFDDGAGCDRQLARGLVACPSCHSSRIGKALMTPSLANARHGLTPDAGASSLPGGDAALRSAMQELRRQVLAGAQDVGRDFAARARQMHEGEIAAKPIYGEASRDEVVSLLEEGVPVLPLPPAPKEQH
ncbi:MAG: DUF1178 family protein [Hyphomicrobiales bacterium]|nr:DUF1178 family protein [Hyphomicrobiales bacterium]